MRQLQEANMRATFIGKITPQIDKILEIALNDIQKIDPNFILERDESYEISEADREDMREILALRERGELEFVDECKLDKFIENIISKRAI